MKKGSVMQKVVVAFMLLALGSCVLHAQEARQDISLANLTKYYIATLAKGPSWNAEKVKGTTEANRAHIQKLVAEGKLVGAVMNQGEGDIRSLFFFKSPKQKDVEDILANAPSVKAGFLKGTVHEIWGTHGLGKNIQAKMKEDKSKKLAAETYYMAIYSKGPKWSEEANEETRAMMAENYKSINRLWKSGTLKFFAVEATLETDVRALGIFASASLHEAEVLATDDPGVTKGWFTVKVVPVTVPEGVLP